MTLQRLATLLADGLRGTVARHVPLARHTTYRLGGAAELLIELEDLEDLERFAGALASADPEGSLPLLPLGRGSNLVVSDRGFPGVVVRLGRGFATFGGSEDEIRVGAAVPLPVLANWAARRALAGVEFLVAVPGSMGGAVRMNAGAHGAQLSDTLVAAEVFDVRSRSLERRPADAFGLGYRTSNLDDSIWVLAAHLALVPSEPLEVRARMDSYRRHRAETQPGAVQNAGSVFKNPPGDHAGRLIEAAGLKGFGIGAARVSELHANFFVADDGAHAQDVYELVRAVRERVFDTFGVSLEPEIRFVGEFEEETASEGRRS